MADLFMRVDEVAEVTGVSNSYAYKIIRRINKELKKIVSFPQGVLLSLSLLF